MKNYEQLNQQCLYDVLLKMHNNLVREQEEPKICILDVITGTKMRCREQECDECIRIWLLEEAK